MLLLIIFLKKILVNNLIEEGNGFIKTKLLATYHI